MREPKGCWLWEFGEAEELTDLGFEDADYEACNYFSDRPKCQRFRHNFEEMQKVKAGVYNHLHSSDCWAPHWSQAENRWIYPSGEEAQYTPSLAYIIALSISFQRVTLGDNLWQEDKLA